MKSSLFHPCLALAVSAFPLVSGAQEPHFTVVVSGAEKAQFTGQAVSCGPNAPGITTTMVILSSGERHVVLSLPTTDPAVAEYPIAIEPTRATALYGKDWVAGPPTWAGASGVLRITSVNSTRIAGAASFEGEEIHGMAGTHVEAEFDAIRAEPNGEFCAGPAGGTPPTSPATVAIPPEVPTEIGTFVGEVGSNQGSTPASGSAAFCVVTSEGLKMLTLRLEDAHGIAWVAGLPLQPASVPVSDSGAIVWLEPSDGSGQMVLNSGFVIVDRFDEQTVIASVQAVHHPEEGSDEGWWHFSAAVNAIPGNCRSD
jgi:hypothetical protein